MLHTLKPVVVRVGATDRRWVASDLVYTEAAHTPSVAKHHWARGLGSYVLSVCLICTIVFRQGGVALGYFFLFVGPLVYGVLRAREERLTYSRTLHLLTLLWPAVVLLLGVMCQIIAAVAPSDVFRSSVFQTLGVLGVVPIGKVEDFALTMLLDLLVLVGAVLALYFRRINLPSKKFPVLWVKWLHRHGFPYVYYVTLLGCSSPFPSSLGFGHLLMWAFLLIRWSRGSLAAGSRLHWAWRVLLVYSVLHVLLAVFTFSFFTLDSGPARALLGPLASRGQMWVLLTCATAQIVLLCCQDRENLHHRPSLPIKREWWQSWWFVRGCRVLGPVAVLAWGLSFPSMVGAVCLCLLTLDSFQLSRRTFLFGYILCIMMLSTLAHYVEGFLFSFLPEDSPGVSLLLGQPSTHASLWLQLLITFVTTVHIKVFSLGDALVEALDDEVAVSVQQYRSTIAFGSAVAVCQWLLVALAFWLLSEEYLHGLVVCGLLGVMLRPPSSRTAWVGLVFAIAIEFVGGYGLGALEGAFPGSLSPGFVRQTNLEHYILYMWGFFVLHLLYSPAYRRYQKLTLQPFPMPFACYVHLGATFFVPSAQVMHLTSGTVENSSTSYKSTLVLPSSEMGQYQPPSTPGQETAAEVSKPVDAPSSLASVILSSIFNRVAVWVCHVIVVMDAVVRAIWHRGVLYLFVGCVSVLSIERAPSVLGVGWLSVLVMLGLHINTPHPSDGKYLWGCILLYSMVSFVLQYLSQFPAILLAIEAWDPEALGLHPGLMQGWAHHAVTNALLVLLAWAQFHSIDAVDRFCIAFLPDLGGKSPGTPWWYQAAASVRSFWFSHASNITIVVLLYISVAYTSVINAVYLIFALSSLLLFPHGRYERCMLFFTVLDALAQYSYQLLEFEDASELGPWIGLEKPFLFWQHCAVVTVLSMQLLSKQQAPASPSWFDKAMKVVYDGNTLEVSYLAIVFVAFDKRNVFSCVDVLIVGCCLLSPLPRIKKAWPVLTTYWLVVFVLKWVCWLLSKRFLKDMPWALDRDADWLGLQTTDGWTTEFVVVCAVVFQLRAFRTDEHREMEIPMMAVQDPTKTEETEETTDELEGVQAAVKAYLVVLLIATFLVGVLTVTKHMNILACLYICVALYLSNCFHRSIAEQERWSVLGLCNFVVLLCKLVYWAPFFTRAEDWAKTIGLQDFGPDLVLFALVLVERRLTRLSLFRKIREYETLAEKRRVAVYSAMVEKTNRKRQVALLQVMIQYLKRQVRYLRRWGKREDDALQNLRDFGFSIPTEASFNSLEDVIKDMEREWAAIELEGQSVAPSEENSITVGSPSLSPSKPVLSLVVARPMPVLDLAAMEPSSSSTSEAASLPPAVFSFNALGSSPLKQVLTPPQSPHFQSLNASFKPSSRSESPLRRSPSYMSPQIGAYASTRSRRKQGSDSALERRSSKGPEVREEKKIVESPPESKTPIEPLYIRLCDRLIVFFKKRSFLGKLGFHSGQSRPAQLVVSFGSWVFAHATLWCYCAFLLAHMLSQNVASCVYPLSMFTFALMSEPSKLYWVVLLRYTQLMLLFKTVFRFNLLAELPGTAAVCELLYYPNAPDFIQNRSFLGDVMGDFLVMLALVGQRHLLILQSLWYTKEAISPSAPQQRGGFLDRLNKSEEKSEQSMEEGEDAPSDLKTETEWYWGLKEHFARIVVLRPERSKDYYARILGLELLFFVGILSLYQSSNVERQSLTRTFARNEVPLQYFLMLLSQFCLIIADRIIYLRRNITAKFWFQVVYVLVVHLFSLISYSDLPRYNQGLLYAAYTLKCIYFYYSGKQIYRGYPPFAFKQFLTNDPSFLAWLRYIAYRAVPFLFEIKTLLDWTCATSTLMMYDWLKLEDIHASLYFAECDLHYRRVWGRARGDKYPLSWKIPLGVLCIFGIALIIWGPFMVFLTGVPIGSQNLVSKAEVKISMEVEFGTYPLFEVSDADAVVSYDRERAETLSLDLYGVTTQADENLQEIVLNQDSSGVWPVSPPSLARLERAVREGAPTLKYSVTFHRPSGVAVSEYNYPLDELARLDLDSVLDGNCTYVRLKKFYPLVYQLNPTSYVQPFPFLVDARLWLRSQGGTQWWAVEPVNINTTATTHQCTEQMDFAVGNCSVLPSCTETHGLVILVLSSKNFLGDLSSAFYTSSIVTLYITFVFSMGRFLRIYVLGMSQRIIYEDIPDVSFIKELCEDIYSARSDHEFELEETMYGELVQLYRSPETMIAKTLPAQALMGHTNWPQNGQLRDKQE